MSINNNQNPSFVMAIEEIEPIKIWNKRMFELIDHAIFTHQVDNKKEFLLLIGVTSTNNSNQIKTGKQSFTHDHFMTACKKFGVSMDWFYGFTNVMKRPTTINSNNDPIQMIKDALAILEHNKS